MGQLCNCGGLTYYFQKNLFILFDNLDTLMLFLFILIERTKVVIVVALKVSTEYPQSFSYNAEVSN